MRQALIVALLVAFVSPAWGQEAPTGPRIVGGYVTGKGYVDMDGLEKKAYLMGLLAYPDRPFDNEPYPHVGPAAELPKNAIYPKEQALIEFVRSELAQDRRVWAFATFTGKKDVLARLEGLVRKEGVKTAVLRQDTVDVAERERWVRDRVREGAQVVLSGPDLVRTGLDLLEFPSLFFFECGYSSFTLM